MTKKEEYKPTAGVVEENFLQYLKKTFQTWEEYFENGTTLGTREIAKLQDRVMGAKLNSIHGFEIITHRGIDDEEQERYSLMIYKTSEAMENEDPLYFFTTKIYR